MSKNTGREYYIELSLLGIAALAFVSNILVVIAIFMNKKHLLKRKSNKLILNLTTTDACVTLSLTCLLISTLFQKDYGNGTKDIFNSKASFLILISTFIALSTVNLVLLTVDRLVAVKWPYFYIEKVQNKYVCGMVLLNWITAFVYALALGIASANNGVGAFIKYSSTSHIVILSFGFLTLSVSNVFIYVEGRNQLRKITNNLRTHSKHLDYMKKEIRLIKKTIGLVLLYTVCWLPFLTSAILIKCNRLHNYLITASWFLVSINYLLNPFLNVSMSTDIRKIFRGYFNL